MASSIEQALIEYIAADSDIIAAIGPANVWYIDAPQQLVRPYITVNLATASNAAYSFCEKRAGQHLFDIHVWTDDQYLALDVGQKIINMLQFFNGTMNGVEIKRIKCTGVLVLRDPDYDVGYNAVVQADVNYIEP